MAQRAVMVDRARRLRRDMTDAERALWRALRGRQIDGFRFRRQHPIGSHIVDFVCLDVRLVVEVDGAQHAEQIRADAARTECLMERGYRVVRYWSHDVLLRLDTVTEQIRRVLLENASARPTRS